MQPDIEQLARELHAAGPLLWKTWDQLNDDTRAEYIAKAKRAALCDND